MTAVRGLSGPLTGALVVSVFAAAWFSWGSSEAATPSWLATVCRIGAVLALLLALLAVVGLVRGRRAPGAAVDGVVDRAGEGASSPGYRRIVLGEAVALVVGGAVVVGLGAASYVVVVVAAVVGVHFAPLARLFGSNLLLLAAAAITLGAVAGLVVGLSSDVAPVTVTGPVTAAVLVATALATLLAVREAFGGRTAG